MLERLKEAVNPPRHTADHYIHPNSLSPAGAAWLGALLLSEYAKDTVKSVASSVKNRVNNLIAKS